MKAINNLKTGVKLIGGFMIVAVIVIIVAVVGYVNMKNINDSMTTLYNDRTLPIKQLSAANTEFYRLRGNIYKALLLSEDYATLEQSVNASIRSIEEQMGFYRATYLVQEEVDGLAQFDAAWPTYKQIVANILAQLKAGNPAEATRLISDTTTVDTRKAVDDALTILTGINVRVAEELNLQGGKTFSSATLMIAVAGVIAVVAAMGMGLLITKSFNAPLGIMAGAMQNLRVGNLNRDIPQAVKDLIMSRNDEIGTVGKGLGETELYLIAMSEAANRIADGDLTISVTPKSEKDELGNAFSLMVTNLRTSVGQVADNAISLGSASQQLAAAANQAGQATGQIAATVQQVAKGTAQQSEAVTKTAAATEQMGRAIQGVAQGAQEQAGAVAKASNITSQITSAIEQVSGNAQAVTRDSDTAAQAARSGAKTVEDTVKGMHAIKAKVGLSAQKVQEMGQRSDQIGAIVETIEDIASQTNLLALNAAIEAARAGEHGKGFAVVADEVRKLAERASAATKEIGGLIKGIQKTVAEAVAAMEDGAKEVENGVGYANEAGKALADILKAAEAVYAQADQAAGAANRMTVFSNELVAAMDSVSAVVEENTASTEEMSANSSEVTQAIENIASVSEENSAAIEEVSASAEEMSAQVEEVTASAQSLAEMAQALQEVVAQFNLGDQQVEVKGKAKVEKRQPTVPGVVRAASASGNGHHSKVAVR